MYSDIRECILPFLSGYALFDVNHVLNGIASCSSYAEALSWLQCRPPYSKLADVLAPVLKEYYAC